MLLLVLINVHVTVVGYTSYSRWLHVTVDGDHSGWVKFELQIELNKLLILTVISVS